MTDPASSLHELLKSHVETGPVPGAVALVARHDRVAVRAVGSLDAAGTVPMARDTTFRIASLTRAPTRRGPPLP
ncbi:serine hydrolase [Embleya sp. NPDC005575]|uniref:serine hydrolase n=1 Tax=Embleya sp. NPDC005575 TaxID=3156892 RepID=UPI0033A933ED